MKNVEIVPFVKANSLSLKGSIIVENVDCKLFHYYLEIFIVYLDLYVEHVVEINGMFQDMQIKK